MTDTPELLLAHHLKALKLPTFLREYDKLARQCASEGLDHVQFLARLVELELIDRERRMIERRIKAAKFPTVKSLDSFDFKVIPRLNKMQVLELARCEWIERRENVIALGPSGTGKTHVALGLGLAACQKGLSVGFTTAAALVHALMEARDERRLLRLQKNMADYKLLIIDELGFVPLSKTGAERNVSTTLIQPVTIFTLASVPMASPRFDLIANPPVRRARCGPFLVRVALSGVSWEASMAGRRGTRRRRTQRHRAVGGGDRVNLERCDGAACT